MRIPRSSHSDSSCRSSCSSKTVHHPDSRRLIPPQAPAVSSPGRMATACTIRAQSAPIRLRVFVKNLQFFSDCDAGGVRSKRQHPPTHRCSHGTARKSAPSTNNRHLTRSGSHSVADGQDGHSGTSPTPSLSGALHAFQTGYEEESSGPLSGASLAE
jgi:hypothetical protein